MELIVFKKKEWQAAAIVNNQEITDIWGEASCQRKPDQGDLIFGKVSSILDDKNAAFVSLGSGKPGLLNGDELICAQKKKTAGERMLAVSTCIQEGQSILVQVKHPGVDRKGPIVTELVSLTGASLVYMPYAGYSAVSKQLPAMREELLQIAYEQCLEQEGLIFRTSAAYLSKEALIEEIEHLREEWQRILQSTEEVRAPSVIKKAGGLAERISKLYPLHRVTELATNEVDAVKTFLPLLAKGAKVMSEEQSENVIQLLERTIQGIEKTVKMGKAALHIEETNAVTAIDVDSGGVRRSTKNQTHLEVNMMAIDEIARQLRLRNTGGMIIVDFLRVDEKEREALLIQMKKKEKADKRLKVGGFTRLGLFEMQRKKAGLPLSKLI
ncbi:ribonuclease E/G [Guptibacillus spartinae]|uniref:ribonuclease E/G n=1 Tax=Guptibacillus spartinae TaxID=3025679 RepID=UPI00235E0B7E|nr:ribonuclease E/G [Pseudalkalibacillus spartinae]